MPTGDPVWQCKKCGNFYYSNIQTSCNCDKEIIPKQESFYGQGEYDLGHVAGWDDCRKYIIQLILDDPAIGSSELIEKLEDKDFGMVDIICKRKNQ
jgi:hypothetical protein